MNSQKKHKTPKEAYFSLKGLGLFDLIPGVRDLPYLVRLMLMIVTVTLVIMGIAFIVMMLTTLTR